MAKPSEPKKPAAKAAAPAKSPAKGKAETAGKPTADHTEATGHDHPSQSEHAKALWQKLHGTSDQRAKGGPAGAPGKKGGFDPKQLKGGGKPFGGGGNLDRRAVTHEHRLALPQHFDLLAFRHG